MSALDHIPPHDTPEFSRLKEECRRAVNSLLCSMDAISSAGRGQRGNAVAREAAALGLSPKRVRAIWDAFVGSGCDWRTLVDRRKYRLDGDTVPAADLAIWHRYLEQNQRKSKPAHRLLVDAWRTGVVRAERPVDPRTGLPRGWGYRNLMRHLPEQAQVTAMREGLGAAISRHVAKVITTRVGLYVGSHYVPDDVLRDFKVLMLSGTGGKEARIGELGVLDLYSAHRFAVHRRPVARRDSDGKKDSIKESEMRFLVAAVMRNHGYSPRGTAWTAELGTAAIRAPLAEFLSHMSGGLVTVQEPGIIGRDQAIPGLLGRGGGNPRHKAALESHHNLLHNESGHLLAQTGHDRKPPEWLAGFERETAAVIDLIDRLPPERAGLLRAPVLEYWQACSILCEIDAAIARRTDHDLEGWTACGHTAIEYRPDITSDDWISTEEMLDLPERRQELLLAAANAMPPGVVCRPRKLSPIEVWAGGAADLIRFPDHVIALMFCDRALGADLRESRRPNAEGEFIIERGEFEPDPMHFRGEVETPDGDMLALDRRQTYGVVINPFDRERLWVYDPAGRYIGAAPRQHRASRLEERPIQVMLGQRARDIAAITGPLRERHAGISDALAQIADHNRAVAAGHDSAEQALATVAKTRQAARFGRAAALEPAPVRATPSITFEEYPEDQPQTREPQTEIEEW